MIVLQVNKNKKLGNYLRISNTETNSKLDLTFQTKGDGGLVRVIKDKRVQEKIISIIKGDLL